MRGYTWAAAFALVSGGVGLGAGAVDGGEFARAAAAWPEGVATVEVTAPPLVGRGAVFSVVLAVHLDEGWTASTSAAVAPRASDDVRLRAPVIGVSDALLSVEQPLSFERAGRGVLGLRVTTTLCRSDRCFVRTLDVSPVVEVVDGAPRDAVARLVERRLELGASPLRQCFYTAIPNAPSHVVAAASASVSGDGIGLALVHSDPASEQLVACARDLMSDVAYRGELEGVAVTLAVAREVAPAAERSRGREGDLCRVGERETRDRPWVDFPAPAPCRSGLQCCGGGMWGSSAYCARVAHCPQLP